MRPLASVLLAVAIGGAHSAAGVRTQMSFDYGWHFKLGDPAGATPELTTASEDPTFEATVNMTCTQLAWSQLGRMGPDDCRGACSATPGCRVRESPLTPLPTVAQLWDSPCSIFPFLHTLSGHGWTFKDIRTCTSPLADRWRSLR